MGRPLIITVRTVQEVTALPRCKKSVIAPHVEVLPPYSAVNQSMPAK